MTDCTALPGLRLNDLDIAILHEGIMHADGGVVFGNVPKTLWEQKVAPDNRNRVPLGINQLLVRGDHFVLLVDCGIGSQLPRRLTEVYGIERLQTWEERLAPHGIGCDEVTHVVLTHLHYDHCGGATTEDARTQDVRPQFPYARYFVQRGEWEDACRPNERTRASYRFRNFLPLAEAGKVEFLEGNADILEGIRVSVSGGHTRYHQMVLIERPAGKVFFPGDICPTPHHLTFTWQCAADLFPLDTMNARKWFLHQTIGTPSHTVFAHDPRPGFRRIGGSLDAPISEEQHAAA